MPPDAPTDATSPTHADVDPERVSKHDHTVGAVATVVVLVAWAVLAAWRPHVTYHLAPVFAGAAWPVALRRGGALRVAPVDAVRGALAGGSLAGLASLALWSLGFLDGPTLWNDGPAIVETLPAVVFGAIVGYRYTRCGPSF